MQKQITLLSLIVVFCAHLHAQDVMMQAWYWDYPKGAWADTIASKASQMANSGFTAVWFPPHAAASSGPLSNGYDPKDLFIGTATTGLGTLAQISNMTNALFNQGIDPVADMVYNHRDGGAPEVNVSVEGWIENYNSTKVTQGDLPYPSDRFHCILPIGGATGIGAGTYYIKIRSASQHSTFHNRAYKIYTQTKKVGWQNQAAGAETEPNAGGGCGEPNNNITLGRDFNANIDGLGCGFDEFALTLATSDFFATDTLFFYLNNTSPGGISGYSDHYIVELWYNNGSNTTNIQSQIKYRTWTDHTQHSSGRGDMNGFHFRPNGNPTTLNGDKDGMWFFYDYDHTVPSTRDTLNAYTLWNWDYLKVRGARMDAVKHFDASYVSNMMSYMAGQGKNFGIAVGEIYSTSVSEYQDWLDAVGNPNARVFDFSLRDNLRQACDESGFDVRNVFQGSAADVGISPFQLVTFVNNHDFRDDSGFASLIKDNSELAYAYIFTNNQLGLPCVFYPDYYGYPNNGYSYYPNSLSGKQSTIDSLIDLHTAYIAGATEAYYLNNFSAPSANYTSGSASKSLIYQLEKGNADVLTAINFGNTPLTVTINLSGVPSGTVFTRVGGSTNATNSFTTSGLSATFTVPARSFAAWQQGLTPLPMELVRFEVKLNAAKEAELDWVISDGEGLKKFVVERTLDGVHFSAIGSVQIEDAQKEFQFIDNQLGSLSGRIFYRIASHDFDGTIAYTPIRSVSLPESKPILEVYPNPGTVENSLIKVHNIKSVNAHLRLLSLDGRLVSEYPIDTNQKSFSVPVSKLTNLKGFFVLQLFVEDTQPNSLMIFIE